ncbi:alkaline phosphatase [Phototrophicus methaneseepsis]|uniref:Alkaline phosphatase n=1 Tax=Phototrophicus methaneseepsis TaxID=2710758 RepID=A0A7S8E6I9_9CHLR|nr:alkaline phosphatase [Phototrophicus methaneseepsis]QPC81262.1 alkaline phosphatase [Phototrophicus methaneseepsis]
MRLLRGAVIAVLSALLLILPTVAQDAPEVIILPVDGAQFLPGALFDVRVEVHAEELPDDFAVTINGEDVLGNAELTSWTAEESLLGIATQAATWRDVTYTEPGDYTVEVVAGGETHTVTWTVREPGMGGAKNVILFIADGGSVAVNTATRLISRGMTEGTYNDRLAFETWSELGLISTSGLDSIITDSANSASAYNTGHKSAVNATGVYPDTSVDPHDDPQVETFASMVKRVLGMSVGIVTTAEYVDATPAAVWAHGRQRNNATRSDYALQIIGDGLMAGRIPELLPEVILGGGADYLLPQTVDGSTRGDDIDVLAAYEEAGYTVVEDADGLSSIMEETPAMLAGFFHSGNMDVWLDRNVYTDNVTTFPNQPGLEEMTLAALEVLSQNENGFYLEVEGASVDKQLHPMDFDRAVADMIELDRTIAATMEWLEANGMLEDTLLVFVPDHAHSFDVYGTVDVEAFNAAEDVLGRRFAIRTYAAAGYPTYTDEDGDYFPDAWDVNITLAWGKVDNPLYTEDYQVSPVPRTPSIRDENGNYIPNPDDDPNGIPLGGNLDPASSTSVHTLQDVPVWANGPGAEYFGGSHENIEIFFGMANALGLNPAASE